VTSAPEDEVWRGKLEDSFDIRQIVEERARFSGKVWSVRTDSVVIDQATDLGTGIERDIVVHPGAVTVIALDEQDRVYLLRQYRHPVAMSLFEPPAGLLDIDGEDPLHTAVRELAEEAGLEAARWHVLVDFFNSPGGSTEALRIYLARDLTPRPGGRVMTGEAEEAYLPGMWVDLEEAADAVLAGRLGNVGAVIGILAAVRARSNDWIDLRPADAPWAVRDHLLANGRVDNPKAHHNGQ